MSTASKLVLILTIIFINRAHARPDNIQDILTTKFTHFSNIIRSYNDQGKIRKIELFYKIPHGGVIREINEIKENGTTVLRKTFLNHSLIQEQIEKYKLIERQGASAPVDRKFTNDTLVYRVTFDASVPGKELDLKKTETFKNDLVETKWFQRSQSEDDWSLLKEGQKLKIGYSESCASKQISLEEEVTNNIRFSSNNIANIRHVNDSEIFLRDGFRIDRKSCEQKNRNQTSLLAIEKATQQVTSEFLSCLNEINPNLALKVAGKIIEIQPRLKCDYKASNSFFDLERPREITLAIAHSPREPELSDSIAHELLHAADLPGFENHHRPQKRQIDAIYGCQNLCSQRQKRSVSIEECLSCMRSRVNPHVPPYICKNGQQPPEYTTSGSLPCNQREEMVCGKYPPSKLVAKLKNNPSQQ